MTRGIERRNEHAAGKRPRSARAAAPAPDRRSRLARETPKTSAALVERATRDIRAILARTLARGMDEVGTYLLDTFYRGDPDEYRSPTSPRHLSLRALAERCGTIDLPVSVTFLSTSLRIAALSRALPPGSSFTKLPMSHRVELLRLPESDIESAAEKALSRAMSVRLLRDEVTEALAAARTPPRGRKPAAPIVKMVQHVGRLLDATPRKSLADLPAAQRAQLRTSLARAEKQLAELRALLED